MSKILTIDIGAGTMDVLYYDTEKEIHYKAVVKSPVISAGEKAEYVDDILVVGTEMGGGSFASVLKKRAEHTRVIMSRSSSATVHQDLARVRSCGITVVEDDEAEELRLSSKYNVIESCDIEISRLKKIISGFDVDFSFDIVGICAQDHGFAPEGLSHLDFRHNGFKAILDLDPRPQALLYESGEIPENMHRLQAVADSAASIPSDEIYVMDSGMAAIMGAGMDRHARNKDRCVVMDVATSHTVGAALEQGQICGFFEYHTRDITCKKIDLLLRQLADGIIDHKKILSEGGHGAYMRKCFGFDNTEIIVATGPKRNLLENSTLDIHYGAPLDDNMMTGTTGLVEAIRRRKKMPAIRY